MLRVLQMLSFGQPQMQNGYSASDEACRIGARFLVEYGTLKLGLRLALEARAIEQNKLAAVHPQQALGLKVERAQPGGGRRNGGAPPRSSLERDHDQAPRRKLNARAIAGPVPGAEDRRPSGQTRHHKHGARRDIRIGSTGYQSQGAKIARRAAKHPRGETHVSSNAGC